MESKPGARSLHARDFGPNTRRPRTSKHPVRTNKRSRRRAAMRWLPVAAALLAGVVFFGLTDHGQRTREALPLLNQIDQLAERAGLGLDHVAIRGHKMTSDREIFAALDLAANRSLLKFDIDATRKRLERLPWVRTARLKRSIPNRVDIEIVERQPFAVWRGERQDILIDHTGRHLAMIRPGSVAHLPRISGANAVKGAARIVSAAHAWPQLAEIIAQYERVGSRRWNFRLYDGRTVELPEGGVDQALSQLMSGAVGARLIDQPNVDIDLRVSGQVTLRPQRAPTGSALRQSQNANHLRSQRGRVRG